MFAVVKDTIEGLKILEKNALLGKDQGSFIEPNRTSRKGKKSD